MSNFSFEESLQKELTDSDLAYFHSSAHFQLKVQEKFYLFCKKFLIFQIVKSIIKIFEKSFERFFTKAEILGTLSSHFRYIRPVPYATPFELFSSGPDMICIFVLFGKGKFAKFAKLSRTSAFSMTKSWHRK